MTAGGDSNTQRNAPVNALIVQSIAPPAVDGIVSAYDQLKPTERVFVDTYIATDDPRGAMIRARPMFASRPSAADPRVKEYLKRPLVMAAISERLKEIAARTELTVERTMQEIARLAYANMGDYIRITPDGEFYTDFSGITIDQLAAVKSVTVEEIKDGRGDDAKDIRKVKFELHDKNSALEKAVKILGLNAPDRLEVESRNVNVNMDVHSDMTPAEAAELYAKTLRAG